MTNYLTELQDSLSQLSETDRNEAMDFYSEYLQDGKFDTYAQAVSKLGTPKQLARKVLADYSIRTIDEPTHKEDRQQESRHQVRTIWLITLGILSTPVSVPLAIAGLAILFAGLLALTAIILAIIVTLVVVFISGVLVFGIGVGVLSMSTSTGMLYIGCGLAVIGGFIMIVPAVLWLVNKLIHATMKFSGWLYGKFSLHSQTTEGRA